MIRWLKAKAPCALALLAALTAQPAQPQPAPATVNGLVFVGRAAEVAPRGRSASDLVRMDGRYAIDVSRVPALQDARFVAVMAKRLGAPLDRTLIDQLTNDVNGFLVAAGRGFAWVGVPEQDATSGVVQVLVIEPRLGQVSVEGARLFPEASYVDALRLKRGERIDPARLNEDLEFLERSNSFRSAVVVAKPGAAQGETDLTLRVTERWPWTFRGGADNTGTRSTGRTRLNFGAVWGNAFGRGHVATYTLVAEPRFEHYVGHDFTYTVPLRSPDLVTFGANYTEFKAKLPEPLDSRGHAGLLNFRYSRTLAQRRALSHGLSAGMDYKTSDSNVLFSDTPVFNSATEILQGVLAYNARTNDRHGGSGLQLQFVYSPGGLTSDNSDEAFATSRARSSARYQYFNAALERLTLLPRGWTWTLNARLQLASDNLLGSEQLAATGTFAVRGFEEGTLYGDRGVIVRNELGPGAAAYDGLQIQAFGFVDAARVSSVERVIGERAHSRVASAGLGVRASVTNSISARLELGRRVASDIPDVASGGWLGHAGFAIQF